MRISLSGITGDSIVDGPGLRLTIFTQGCLHNCPGCHNPQTHDPSGGSWADTEDILAAAAENPLLDGHPFPAATLSCSLSPALLWQRAHISWA